MPDLLPTTPIPSPAPLQPPSSTSPVPVLKALNPLHGPKDGKFLGRPPHMAGREVCIVLYATSDSRELRERAWREKANEGVNMAELGLAAQAIEEAGYNWRELDDHEDVLSAAETLKAPGATH